MKSLFVTLVLCLKMFLDPTVLEIRKARTHNLKNISLDIPRNQLVVITGLSGSGKSSLAFDTLYAEGQRRYVESLSAYARQFLSIMDKPDVDHISGLSPAIAIEQKTTSHNPRSTVGTVTEIYDYLRLLFARIGIAHCPVHHQSLKKQNPETLVTQMTQEHQGKKMMILAPIVIERKGTHEQVLLSLKKEGFLKILLNGLICDIDDIGPLDPKVNHSLSVVIDRMTLKEEVRERFLEAIEVATKMTKGSFQVAFMNAPKELESVETIFLEQVCRDCGFSAPKFEPRDFSFNSPKGLCEQCDGLGCEHQIDKEKVVRPELTLSQGALWGFEKNHPYYHSILTHVCKTLDIEMNIPFEKLSKNQQLLLLSPKKEEQFTFTKPRSRFNKFAKKILWTGVIDSLNTRYKNSDQEHMQEQLKTVAQYLPCSLCDGGRLNPTSSNVKIHKWTLPKLTALSIAETMATLKSLALNDQEKLISDQVIKEILQRLGFLCDVGLDYLTLSRSADTLSGGESQRIRLASQIGSKLVGVLYVLDEPSIGLHQRDNERLLKTLESLVKLGNSVLVVEHDKEAIERAEHIIDMGPGAGTHGGEIIAQGTYEDILKSTKSLTAQYLSGKKTIAIDSLAPCQKEGFIEIHGAYQHNLKKVHAKIPLGQMTCITGVSGSGKSTLINKILYPYCAYKLNRAHLHEPLQVKKISGLESLEKVVAINQSPIGKTPRSNPATYTGLFTPIRELLSQTEKARGLGYKPGRFSFNIPGGRCDACDGDGVIKVEMHFLSDIYVTCEVCQGSRYNEQTLSITYKRKNIAQILQLTVDDALEFFDAIPGLKRKLELLSQVGLGYIHLGQSATTLSGGEAQRIKLAKELSRRDQGKTLYILDEPTTGLHFADIQKLLDILCHLKKRGNTICLIEHNIEVINCADWIIDIGPEGGHKGGYILYQGEKEGLKNCRESATAKYID